MTRKAQSTKLISCSAHTVKLAVKDIFNKDPDLCNIKYRTNVGIMYHIFWLLSDHNMNLFKKFSVQIKKNFLIQRNLKYYITHTAHLTAHCASVGESCSAKCSGYHSKQLRNECIEFKVQIRTSCFQN